MWKEDLDMASLGYMQYKDGKLGYIYEESPKEVDPKEEQEFELSGWAEIEGGGEVFPPEPQRGMPPPC